MTNTIAIVAVVCWAIGVLAGCYVMHVSNKNRSPKEVVTREPQITATRREVKVIKAKTAVPLLDETHEERYAEEIKRRLAMELAQQIEKYMNFEVYKDPVNLETVYGAWISIIPKEQ